MKNIRVELLHYTPMTFLLKSLSMPRNNESVDITLAEKVIKVMKHESVGEHVTMNFLIDGVSRLELQEHMRHRIASTTCESTRYTLQLILDSLNVDEPDHGITEELIHNNFVIPDMGNKDCWNLDFGEPESNYDAFTAELELIYCRFVDFALEWRHAGVSNDFIKYALPEGYRTRFTWSINLRSLNNFLMLRDSPSSHFEIRLVAQKIRETLENTYIKRLT